MSASGLWRMGAQHLLLVACVVVGCGDDSASDDDAAGGAAERAMQDALAGDRADAGNADGDPERLIGTFTIALVEENASTGTPALSSMRGFVRDAPVNELTVWEPVDAVGGCALETPRFPFCEPECGSGRACVDEDVCRDDPVAVDVGAVTVSGVQTSDGATDFALMRIGPSYQPEGRLGLAYPPAPEGAEVRIAADGGDLAPFEITTRGIAPLELHADGSLEARPATTLSVTWTPPGADSGSSMAVLVDLSHHGGSKGRIVCDVDDAAGRLDIDASLVTALIDLGTAGFPSLRLTRRSVGSTVTQLGRIELSIEHGIELPLEIPGLVSCTDSAECADGERCLPTRKCG